MIVTFVAVIVFCLLGDSDSCDSGSVDSDFVIVTLVIVVLLIVKPASGSRGREVARSRGCELAGRVCPGYGYTNFFSGILIPVF
jgi:hypothetical protein